MQAPATPGSGEKLDLKALNGTLLYITVGEHKRDIETSFGPADAIAADVTALDGEHKGETYTDVLVFPRVLVSQLAKAVGSSDPNVVGRLGQGEAKPGKSAPWLLLEPTAEDMAVATKYEAYAAKVAAEQESPF